MARRAASRINLIVDDVAPIRHAMRGAFGVIAKGEHPQKAIELIEQAWRLRHL